MNNKLSAYVLSALIGAASIIGITQSFFFSEIIQNSLKRVLPFRVDPAFAGGDILMTALDPPGDDNGAGNLSYPLNSRYAERAILDLVSYTVREPQTGVIWSAEENFWQLETRFGRLPEGDEPFSRVMIRIYIDLDGDGRGSLVPLYETEQVTFTPAHPWDIAVEIDGRERTALIRNSTGKTIGRCGFYTDRKRRTISIRLPLDRSPAAVVLAGRPTWHYVTVSAAGLYDEGHILPVKSSPGKNAGGGAESGMTPPLYDILVPEGKSQQRILSGYDEDSFRPVTLLPVEISSVSQGDEKGETIPEQAQEEVSDKEEPDPDSVEDPLWKGILLFNLGRSDEAETLLEPLTRAEEPSPLALAYYGAIVAQKGGEATNPVAAMGIVWDSYRYLNRAVDLAEGADRLHALHCRAAVSMSIPESVFAMNESGMNDYDEIAWLSLDLGDRAGAAEAWFKAGRCAGQAGREEEETLFIGLGTMVNR